MQVGDPWKDHDCWERPEDMDTERTVYNVSAGRPGSDIAGETAAALAAASMVFRDDDPEYAETLLASARKAFEFADTYKGAYSDDPDLRAGGCPFYCDFNGYQVRCLSRFPASVSRWRHDLCRSASSQEDTEELTLCLSVTAMLLWQLVLHSSPNITLTVCRDTHIRSKNTNANSARIAIHSDCHFNRAI